jgi:glycosyltransferase involved in cell wall biosynthesis
MRVSVIVATYDREDRIGLCLAALYNQSCTEFEIIVADDGSQDDTYFEVCAARDQQEIKTVFVSHQHDGWGLARTRNEGARLATGDMLVFIDADILLNPDAIGHYHRLYKENRERVIAGYYKYLKGMQITKYDVREWRDLWLMRLPGIPCEQHCVPLGYDVREYLALHGKGNPAIWDDDTVLHLPQFSLLGGNMGIPRHIWEQTEGFDEGITCYGGEDGELSLQIADLGYPLSFSKDVAGAHMAHPKAFQGEPPSVLPYIIARHRNWFKDDGSPAWGS